jgi:putative ABC transport system permease protein
MAFRSRGLLRTAPWTRAPLLAFREPAVAVVVGAVAFVIGLVAASGPLYDASSGSGALALEMSAQRCQSLAGTVARGTGPLTGVTRADAALDALSQRALSRAGAPVGALGTPVVTLDAQVSVGRSTADLVPGQLATQTGGLAHIARLGGSGGRGVWISGDLAQALRVRPGGHIVVAAAEGGSGTPSREARVRVAGTYQALVGTTLPPFWCGLTPVFGTFDDNAPPPPVMLASGPAFASVLRAAGIPTVDFYQWERPPSSLDLPHGRALAAAIGAFRHHVGTVPTRRLQLPDRLPGGLRAIDAEAPQYAFLVQHAEAVQAAVSQGVVPEIVAGLVVGMLLLASASVFWVSRRRTEVGFLLSRGVPPGWLGVKAALEASLLMVVGGAAGWAGSVALLSLVGPSASFGPTALARSALAAAVAVVAALVLLGLIAAAVSASGQRPRRHVPPWLADVPFELVGIGIALWLWSSLSDVSLEAGGTTTPVVQIGFIVMPLLLLLSASVLCARMLSLLLRRCRTLGFGPGRRIAWWLSLRRLAAAPGLAMLMVGSVALAVGTFTFAGAMARSQQYTLTAKAETFVGSDVAFGTTSIVRLPAALAGSSTEVLSENSSTVATVPVDTLGINTGTFAQGAFWDPSYAPQSLGALLGQLASARSSGGSIPVIVVGSPPSLTRGVLFPYGTSAGPVRVRVIARASTFPGQNGQSPLIVMTRADLARIDQAATDEIWTTVPPAAATSALVRAGIRPTAVLAAGDELGQIQFAPIEWTFQALQALGVLVGVLAFAGLFLFLTARARARSLAYALGVRMGVTRRTHFLSLGAEIGLLFGAALVIGMVSAWVTTALVNGLLNPIPDLPPSPLLEVPWPSILIALLAASAVWVSSALWAQHVTESRSAAGVLRYDID